MHTREYLQASKQAIFGGDERWQGKRHCHVRSWLLTTSCNHTFERFAEPIDWLCVYCTQKLIGLVASRRDLDGVGVRDIMYRYLVDAKEGGEWYELT